MLQGKTYREVTDASGPVATLVVIGLVVVGGAIAVAGLSSGVGLSAGTAEGQYE